MASEEYLPLKVPSQMATQASSVTFCENESQDPQKSKSLFVTEESTEKKVLWGESPSMDHCSENLQIKLMSDVIDLVSPLVSGETNCQNGQVKDPLDLFDCNYKDICGWKSQVVGRSHRGAHTEKAYNHYNLGKRSNNSSDGHPCEKIHTAEKLHRCSHCGKDFSEHSELLLHQRHHTEEKPYKCEQCGKGFTRSSSLLIHRAAHTDEKPYKCDKCGKGFTRSSSLLIHHAVHTGEKPYKCDKCGKGFSQSSKLHIHQRVHTVMCWNLPLGKTGLLQSLSHLCVSAQVNTSCFPQTQPRGAGAGSLALLVLQPLLRSVCLLLNTQRSETQHGLYVFSSLDLTRMNLS
ncbi:zinc finger protein 239 isoform X2 [Canis lupus familiaris]|uniref:zinc finger protein 239 isoform X2 n=1 Tax=Canis lupus familiaris TaxID=9615 RepID=UPI0018F4A869|nr:zinc finger protein 239 isoform X2 [Canis lupus familiaris]